MRYAINPVRPGLAAIAAVLALSATPALAQEAPTLDIAPPATTPSSSLPSVVPDTGPGPAPGTDATAPTVQPAPGGAITGATATPMTGQAAAPAATPTTTSTPVIALPAPATLVDAPPPPSAREAMTATAARGGTSTRFAPVRTEQATPANTEILTDSAATPPAPPAAPLEAATMAAPTPAQQAAVPAATNDDGDMLPVAGAAGAALLLLGGGIYAATRRRRADGERTEAVSMTSSDEIVAPRPALAPIVAAPPVAPVTARTDAGTVMAASSVPAGFDLSRFGRHMQAAYRGPTPENPFLSLRRRLKRASFLDGRERVAAAPIATNPATPRGGPAAATAPVRQAGLVTTKVRSMPPRPGFRPAFQG